MKQISYDAAQLIVPLMDFVSRWSMFGCKEKSDALVYFKTAGFEPHELAAIEAFLIDLDNPEVLIALDNPEDEEN